MANAQISNIFSAAGVKLPPVPALSVGQAIPMTLVTSGLSLINNILSFAARIQNIAALDKENERKFQLAMSEIDQRKEKIKNDLTGFEKKMENITNTAMIGLSHIRFSIDTLASIAVKETDGDRQLLLIEQLTNLSQEASLLTRATLKVLENCSLEGKQIGGE